MDISQKIMVSVDALEWLVGKDSSCTKASPLVTYHHTLEAYHLVIPLEGDERLDVVTRMNKRLSLAPRFEAIGTYQLGDGKQVQVHMQDTEQVHELLKAKAQGRNIHSPYR